MIDRPLLFITITLLVITTLFSYSLTTYTTLYFGYNQFHFFIRQFIAALGAILLMWAIARLDPHRWAKPLGIFLFLGSLAVMVAMPFLPSSLVTSVGGAKRWIHLGPLSLAPVEFFKVGFIFFLAWSFSRKFSDVKTKRFVHEIKLIAPYIVIFLFAAFFIAILQNDLGQVMVLGLTLSVLLIFAGRSFKLFLTLFSLALILFVLFVSISAHRIERIKMWWASAQKFIISYLPSSLASEVKLDNVKESYQIVNSLNAIHHGGILGQGLGNGQLKLGFLSDVHTDFVLAGITEEIGFLGLVLLVALYIALLHRLFKIANSSINQTTYLFSAGIALLLGFTFLMNAYGISSLIPIKGIAVPLLSYGGSSLWATAIALGMVLMLSKSKKDHIP